MSRRVHDFVAQGYNSTSGIIADKNRVILEALQQRIEGRTETLRVVDLGVGDGALLKMLEDGLSLPLEMTGVDVSPAMLGVARTRVKNLRTVHASATEAASHLPHGSFDLVLAHFILAYVKRRELLKQARALLAPGGVMSLVTSTNHSAAGLHEQLDRLFRHSPNPLRRFIAKAIDNGFAKSDVPDSFEDLLPDFEAAGLDVINRQTLRFPLHVEGPADAYRLCIEEGWAANILSAPMVPVHIMTSAARMGLEMFEYPYICVQVVEVVDLVAKP
ncbi:trans-aconitate 2-methyltransferase [Telmatospirillum sp. J64-1]|uniref:class I SAM-dependent methyltransferase n=1 Tax=Telmatospirillum sp. J64-1 TaxID=2502183 RepID=UPI00115F1E8E|nr:class I SAM-dependent methyltransferase [Telmatospirillum sp. J64-1]